MKTNTIHLGDCLQLMKKLPACSIDEIVTDPPYGLKFMGQDWDKAIPPLSHFLEMHRVLKPGSFCFVFSSPRQDLLYRMTQRLEQAGFMIDFPSIYWTYATGIGLGQNCSKMIDKRLGVKGKVIKKYDKPSGMAKSRVEQGYRKTVTQGGEITAPASDLAREFDGAYIRYRPKPCLEVIIVAMKPVETRTYIDQVMKNGKACTWLDRCRIPVEENDKNYFNTDLSESISKPKVNLLRGSVCTKRGGGNKLGRYPTHLLSSDNRLDTGEIKKSGDIKPHHKANFEKTDKVYGKFKENRLTIGDGDSGSYNRYFCFDSWCRENLPKTYPFLPVTKPSAGQKAGRESHLTEKPPQIFAYLITLASRPGDIILDPYAGSGSCSLAAATLNRDYLAVELEKKHVKIARERLKKLIVKRKKRKINSENQ